VGDSFTWGDKIADSDSTWPAQLEAELHRRLPGREFEVINLGRNGFTTVNAAEMLRRVGWQFDPDLVVVQYFFNDILPSGPNFAYEPSQWLFPRTRILPRRFRDGPVGRSALLQLVEARLGSLREARGVPSAERWAALFEVETPYWRDMAGAIREMGQSAHERNVPIVYMMFPYFVSGDRSEEPLSESPYVARVAEKAKEAGFAVLDLVPVYTEEGGDWRRWWATPYDSHPNEEAAGVAARALADHLLGEMALWQ
jgi:lysophospholipase L1-like esterase